MRKIENLKVLIQFEQLAADDNGLQIIEHNNLTKEEYIDFRYRAEASVSEYENSRVDNVLKIMDRMKKITPDVKDFYERRVDERLIYSVDVLLTYEHLPEDLLRQLHLSRAEIFVLVWVDNIYVGLILGRPAKVIFDPISTLFKDG